MTWDSVNKKLTGTPTVSGLFSIVVNVTDANSCAGTLTVPLRICPLITIAPATLANATVGSAYTQATAFSASGGTAPYTFAAPTGIPAGMAWDSVNLKLTGTPTTSGSGSITLNVTDLNGCPGTATVSLTRVCPTITVSPTTLPSATINAAYTQATAFSATGLTGTYTWTAAPLPAGMAWDAVNKKLTGTPTAAGLTSIVITATDSTYNTCAGSTTVNFRVCPIITITPTSLANGTVGLGYTQATAFAAAGGTAPYTFSTPTGIPAGMSWDAVNLKLTGTPSASGTGNIVLNATDVNGCPATQLTVPFTRVCPTISVSPATLAFGTIGVSYSQATAFSATGGSGSYTFSATGVPAGMSFDAVNKKLIGLPTTAGLSSVTITATDATYPTCSGNVIVSFRVCPNISITPTTIATGTVGVGYSQGTAFSASGGTAPYTFAAPSGLPAGITWDAVNLKFIGTPTTAGTTNITLNVTDVNGCPGSVVVPLTRNCPTISVTPTTLPTGLIGSAYTQPTAFSASSSGSNVFTWSATGVPAGMTFDAVNKKLTGTPTTAGLYSVVVTATDANSCAGSTTISYRVCPIITLTPTTLANATVGTAYSQATAFTAAGGTGPYTYSASGLSSGLSFDAVNAKVIGTPTTSAVLSVTVTATDSTGCQGSVLVPLTIGCPGMSVAPGSLPFAYVGAVYSQATAFSATGGSGTYNFTASGVPAGMTFDAVNKKLTGTPTTAGLFSVTVTATDATYTSCSASVTLSFRVCPIITISPATLPAGTVGSAYAQGTAFSAAGGTAPYTFSVTGLPATLTFSSATNLIAGTPIAQNSYTLTITATDATGCVGTTTRTLAVSCPPITVTPTSIANGTINLAYTQATAFSATGGTTGSTYTWSATGVPAGMTFDAVNKKLTGTPTAAGLFNVIVTATDGNACAGSVTVPFRVCPIITITPNTLTNATVGSAYTQATAFTATGGTATYTFSATGLPAGMSFDAVNKKIIGTPTASGTSTITINVTDGTGCPGTVSISLTRVCPTITLSPTSLANGTVGLGYTQATAFSATGLTGTYNWTASPLPAGMAWDAVNKKLTGTPTTAGVTNIVVTATDSTYASCSGSVTVPFRVCPVLTLTPATLANATVGTAYSQATAFAAGNGTAPYVFAAPTGIPAGMSWDSVNLKLIGTPTTAGTYTITLNVTDATSCPGTFTRSLTVGCPTISVTPTTLPNAPINVVYTQATAFSATGGSGTYTYAASGVPTGMTFDAVNKKLIGTPTAAGLFNVTITATDSTYPTCSGNVVVPFRVCPVITISPTTLANATVGAAYTQATAFAAAGGTAPYTFSVPSGIPAGMAWDSVNLKLTGTPTAAGTGNIVLNATDVNGCPATALTVSLTRVCPTINVSPNSLANGTINLAYTQATAFSATGGSGTYNFSATGLPTGLSMDTVNKKLIGTPTVSGLFSVVVTATDATYPTCSGSVTISLRICPIITISPSTLANATVGVSYTQATAFSASGGTAPYTFSAPTGIPAGMAWDSVNLKLTGTPTAAGTANIVLGVTDSTGCPGTLTLPFTRVCPTITVTPTSLANGTINLGYTQATAFSATTAGNNTFTWTASGLPTGMTFDAVNKKVIGTPTVSGMFTMTITATNAHACVGSASVSLRICPIITITPTTLANATVGAAYTQATAFAAAGGTAPYTFGVPTGIPAGMSWDSVNLKLTGTPTTAGTGNIVVSVTDATGCPGTLTVPFTRGCSTITVSPGTLPNAYTTAAYVQPTAFSATGGSGTYTYSAVGVPTGMTFDTVNKKLTGTPTVAAGTYTVTVTAIDSTYPSCSGSVPVTLRVCPIISIAPATIPAGTVGTAYAQGTAFSATGGTAPYTLSVSGLPATLTFTPGTGLITGTPTSAASYTLTITATDATNCVGTATRTLAVSCPPITITPNTLPVVTVNTAYNQPTAFSATGGTTGATYTWSASSVPTGMSFDAVNKKLIGTPTVVGLYNVVVTATDGNACVGTVTIPVRVCPVLTITPATLANATVGSAYTQATAFTTTGGTAPYAYSASGLPAGMAFDAVNAKVTGTPTASGTGNITVSVTDANGCPGSLVVALTRVCPTISVSPSSLANGTINLGYTQATAFSATGLSGSYTWGATGVPTGMIFDAVNKKLTGTPTVSGLFSVVVTATDATYTSCSGSVTVPLRICPIISITPTTLANGTTGVAYSQATAFAATGGTAPYTFAAPTGIPAGMSWDSVNKKVIGTPTTAGTSNIVLNVTDNTGCPGTLTVPLTIGCPTITVSPSTAVQAPINIAYNQVIAFSATGGSGTYNFTASSVPTGMTFDAVNKKLTGTPTAAGLFSVTVTATDATYTSCSGSVVVPFRVCPVITVTPTTLASATVGSAYTQATAFAAAGGTAPYTFAVPTGIPAGMSWDSVNLKLTGTPTTSGSGNVVVSVTDVNGCPGSVTVPFTRTCPTITVSPSTLAMATAGSAYIQATAFSATGLTGTYNWTASGVPAGMTFDTVNKKLTGSPSAAGLFSVVVTATDSTYASCAGSVTVAFRVCPVLAITPTSLANGTVGLGYTQATAFAAANGTAPYTFAAPTGLPPGITWDAVNLKLIGTPTTAGTSSITLNVTDANGCPGSLTVSLTRACPTITVTPASLAFGTVGTAYSQATAFSASSVGNNTFTWTASGVPAGMTFDAVNKKLTGTPTTAGLFTTVITATDANLCAGSVSLSFRVCPVITITPASLSNGIVGTAYNQALTATGGTGPYTWAVTSGSLPAGLGISGGAITGTPSAATASASFTITATDVNGCPGSIAYTMSTSCPAMGITPVAAQLADGLVGTPYTGSVSITGGSSPYTWSIASGTLPTGITFSNAGVFGGTPTTATTGTTGNAITVQVVDQYGCVKTKAYNLKVCPVISISGSPPVGTVNVAYSTTFTATNGTAPYTWTLTGGTLQTGLSLSSGGVVSGTPTTTGSANITVKATDANGCTGTGTFTVAVGCPAATLAPATLPLGIVGTAYTNTTMTVSVGTAPITYSLSAGVLPAGLTLSNAGLLSGTPTAATSGINGTSITVQATDSVGCITTQTYNLKVCPVMSITPASPLPNATVGVSYTRGLTLTGGTGPFAWSIISGSLPPGIGINAVNGGLTGTPTLVGLYNFTVQVLDVNQCAASIAYTLRVCPVITLTPTTLANATVGTAYSQGTAFAAAGGIAPYTYSATGVPAGLTFDAVNKVLTGTPTTAGLFTVAVTANDANGCTSVTNVTIRVCPVISITPVTLANATVGSAYTQATTFAATGGTAPYTWAAPTGIPAGMAWDNVNLKLTGTPTTAGSGNIVLNVTDANSCPGTLTVALTRVCPTITVTPTTLAFATIGTAYNQATAFSATGLTGTYTWSASNLPPAMSFDAVNKKLTGTPTTAGLYNVTVTATDTTYGTCSGSVVVPVRVCPVLSITPATLANATVGSAYSQATAFAASNGTAPYTFGTPTGIPAGMTWDAVNLKLTGTPTTAGTGNIVVSVTDANGCPGSLTVSLTRVCPTITVTPTTLAFATVGSAYSQATAFSATGLTGTYTWTASGVPAGLSFDAVNKKLIGTPTTAGLFNVTITATDTTYGTCSGNVVVPLRICPVINITPTSLANGIVGVGYTQATAFAASNGTAPYAFATPTGIPAGMSWDAVNLKLIGTPTSAGTGNIVLSVTDSVGCPGTLTVPFTRVCPTITVTPTTLAFGTVGSAYTQATAFSASSAGNTTFTWGATGVPAGMSFDSVNKKLTGTPTTAGLFTVVVTATDANACAGSTSISFRVCPVITITPATVANGTVGSAYSQALTATGGTGPYSWAVTSGTPPTGLSVNASGVLAGTPSTVVTNASFTVTATDANGCPGVITYTMSTACPTMTITPAGAQLPDGLVGTAYSQTLAISAGTAPFTWSVSAGSLPAGLTLSSGGVVSGTPTGATTGTTGLSFTARVQDTYGCATTKVFNLKICPVITVNGSPGTGTISTPYSATFNVAGGTAPYTWAVTSGSLPTGLTLNASTGVVSGTPTVVQSSTFTLAATDANLCAGSNSFTISVGCPPATLNPTTIPSGTVGTPYTSTTFVVSAGRAPISYTISAGSLPAGLTLTTAGVLSGTPTVATSGINGTAITVRATDADNCITTAGYNLKICPGHHHHACLTAR